jgi:ABC-type multidrug transport system fused ATPase/permease subunit
VARRFSESWQGIAPFFAASRPQIGVLAAASVVAGLAEAALLALVAATASALSMGERSVHVDLGPSTVGAGVSTLFVIGIVLALLRGVLQVLLAYLPAKMSSSAMAGLRRRLFDAFTGTSWSVQAAERDGHFQSLINSHVNSTSQAVIALADGITAVMMFVTLLVSAFALSVPTALILIVSSGGLFFTLRPVSRRLRSHATELSAENVAFSKSVQEVVLMAEETQVFGASESYRDTFYAAVEDVREPYLRTRFLSSAVPAMYQSAALLLLVLALIVLSLVDTSRLAALGAVVLILIRSLTYAQNMQRAVASMDEFTPFMQRLAEAIHQYEATPQQDGDRHLPPIERLGMDDVHFSYVPGIDILRGIAFEAHRGEAIGVVGPSGAGKSSIVQLLLRLRDPGRGRVHVNGADASSFRRIEWQQRVAYVPQTSQLIHGTVAENIRFYRPELSDHDVETAARRAHVHDEIMSWPEGYQTVVGQRASAVSGGQRQRLCLARALADRPDVLILDEPTSALDVKSEMLVQESLHRLKGDVILFLVAHRLSTLSICDRVMVIVGGQLEAIDEPSQLLTTNDFYREVTEITRQQSNI